jgi:hypothetical protein
VTRLASFTRLIVFDKRGTGLSDRFRTRRCSLRVIRLGPVRDVLPAIRVPTLVLHRGDDAFVRAAHGRYLAEHIPEARYVELTGRDYLYCFGETDQLLDEVHEFLTGVREPSTPDRVLATVMFTDIVGSTERLQAVGDRRWRDLLQPHHSIVRQQLQRFRGREIDTAGDGSSQPSTGRPERSGVPTPSEQPSKASDLTWASAFTLANASCSPRVSAGSRFISAHALPHKQVRVRSSYRGP